MIKGLQLALIIMSSAALINCSGAKFGLTPTSLSFGQKIVYNTQVDILVVMDTTSSMVTKQSQLANSFPSFIDYMTASQFDFNIAIISMDMGAGSPKGAFQGSPQILNRSTPNLRQAFVNNINLGTSGGDLQQGLFAMQTSLSTLAGPGGVDAGFLRPGALLAIIFISDEDDFSANSSSYYASFLDSIKPAFPWGYKGWVANSIVVQSLSSQCLTYNNFAGPGIRYMDLTNTSGGVTASVCDGDLVTATASIRARVAEILTQYHLDPPADPTTIQVFINGISIANDATNGWTYDSNSSNVMFHGAAVPPANANVQIAYTPTSIKH